ncbi:arylamine N-acetyltransferase family protein [Kitasatospora terrestris]|uniref:Arylamine N-acetyltransferase n=1 Tax=Kitasatospora terrestris TaxID=258051 RepID=A0ABP9ECC8_9ACTN
MLNPTTVDRYLARLDFPRPAAPDLAGLRALHRAHVERIPYETVDVWRGTPTLIEPEAAVERIVNGRGGYCYHLNGAFAALLESLGHRVELHRGGIQSRRDAAPRGATGDHMVLTVQLEGRRWYVDVGLGDGPSEPLPLPLPGADPANRSVTHRQGPFSYRLRPSEAVPGGWRLDHDDRACSAGLDFDPRPVSTGDFLPNHHRLSTSPDSLFTQVPLAIRRTPDSYRALIGLVLTEQGAEERTTRELTSEHEWFAALADRFDLPLPELGPAERSRLWSELHAAHLARRAAQRQPAEV